MTFIKLNILVLFSALTFVSLGQVYEAHIVFERRTNLEKRFEGVEDIDKLINKRNKYRLEEFHLYFNDTVSLFQPGEIETDDPLSWATTTNTVFRNIRTTELITKLDLNGNPLVVKDSIRVPSWRVTDDTRFIGEYNCQKAYYERGDSVRIYAWYTTDLVPSIGPESVGGLPGTILGLAKEDGGVVYFAKSVEIGSQPLKVLTLEERKAEILTIKELNAKFKGDEGNTIQSYILEDLFRWI